MPDNNRIVDIVLDNEDPTRSGKVTVDGGGRTQFGISERANPEAWADGQVTEAESREIYMRKYIQGPGFDKVADFKLRAQLVDFGVNSGPMVAIMKLQEIVGATVDGILGPESLQAIAVMPREQVNAMLVASRVRMIGRIVKKNPADLKNLNGWLDRALEFL